jgi:hypothetical protein
LFVNSAGPVDVSVIGDDGAVLASASLAGDSLAHKVAPMGKSIADWSRGAPVRFRFTIGDQGRLYSFTVRK